MAKSLYDKLIGQGFNPGEAGIFIKGLERISNSENTAEEQFLICVKNMYPVNYNVTIEDIKHIANQFNMEPDELHLDEVLLRYPIEQKAEPTGTWNMIIESLLYEVMSEDYDCEYGISTEEIVEVAKKWNLDDQLTPEIIGEIKDLYYQNDEVDKEMKKGIILIGCVGGVLQYL